MNSESLNPAPPGNGAAVESATGGSGKLFNVVNNVPQEFGDYHPFLREATL
jgi:hypothetical protein